MLMMKKEKPEQKVWEGLPHLRCCLVTGQAPGAALCGIPVAI